VILAILFRPFVFLAPKDLKIIWLSNILALSIPHEAYSRNVLCALNLISVFLFTDTATQSVIFGYNLFSSPKKALGLIQGCGFSTAITVF
jgi:hypothetical protein